MRRVPPSPGGPEAVIAYLTRYTHRVAISNRRLIAPAAETLHTSRHGAIRATPPNGGRPKMLANTDWMNPR
jgi:hypothetical protein